MILDISAIGPITSFQWPRRHCDTYSSGTNSRKEGQHEKYLYLRNWGSVYSLHWCNYLICPHFPVHIWPYTNKWHTRLCMPLECRIHHLACTIQGHNMRQIFTFAHAGYCASENVYTDTVNLFCYKVPYLEPVIPAQYHFLCSAHNLKCIRPLEEPGGVYQGPIPLWVQFLSFSCSFQQTICQTTMHFSMMRTDRRLTVSWRIRGGGGGLDRVGDDVSGQGGVYPGGWCVCPGRWCVWPGGCGQNPHPL